MTRLWLIRHGPTHSDSLVGWSDIPADLSDTARIARLEAALPDAPVVSSDLDRAVKTADALTARRVRLDHAPELREIHFGDWELRSQEEVAASDPVLARTFWESPGSARPPGGESWDALRCRVHGALDRLAGRGHEDLIVVAHFGVILCAVQRALGIGAADAFAHRVDPLSLTRVDAPPWRAGVINHMY